jgi:orotate phosphoribosyltransferase
VSDQWSGDEAALLALLRTRTFKRGEFTLVSGKRSRIYFNMKATMMHPQGASLCARLLLAKIAPLKPDYMGGLEMGAVPLLGTVAAYSADAGQPIPAIFVRKAAKSHGTSLMIEGLDDSGGETLAGKSVILVDDVATSGGSVLKAIEEIAAAGGEVTDAIVILDREQGATEFLRGHGVTLHALFTATDLGVTDADRAPL